METIEFSDKKKAHRHMCLLWTEGHETEPLEECWETDEETGAVYHFWRVTWTETPRVDSWTAFFDRIDDRYGDYSASVE